MNLSRISNQNTSFKGLLTISGPNKGSDVTLNTNSISTIREKPYFDKKEDTSVGIKTKQNTVITLNNGISINTYVPTETVVDAYKKAKVTGEYKLETKFNPLVEKQTIIL